MGSWRIEWIWRRYPRSDHDRPSLDPTFQGMVGNAPGGPPSPCGIPLRRTGRARYILVAPRQDDGGQLEAPASQHAVSDTAAGADPALARLQEGPLFRFADWPNDQVPQRAAGVYTIWRAEKLL